MTAELASYGQEALHFQRAPSPVRAISLRMDNRFPNQSMIWDAISGVERAEAVRHISVSPIPSGIRMHWFSEVPVASPPPSDDPMTGPWETFNASQVLIGIQIVARRSDAGTTLSVLSFDELRVHRIAGALGENFQAARLKMPRLYKELMEVLGNNLESGSGAEHQISFGGLELETPDARIVLEANDEVWSLQDLKEKVDRIPDKRDKKVNALYIHVGD